MSIQRVTIELPEAVFRQLERVARITHQPIESLVAQSVISNLPPSIEDAPAELQAELLNLQTLDDESLRAIAQSQVDPAQHRQHTRLLQKNAQEPLNPEEREQLAQLRRAADHLMLRKAYAWSLLRWRGHRVPALNELTVPV
jgi:hypothetical protein